MYSNKTDYRGLRGAKQAALDGVSFGWSHVTFETDNPDFGVVGWVYSSQWFEPYKKFRSLNTN